MDILQSHEACTGHTQPLFPTLSPLPIPSTCCSLYCFNVWIPPRQERKALSCALAPSIFLQAAGSHSGLMTLTVCMHWISFILSSVDGLWAGPSSQPWGILLVLKGKPSGDNSSAMRLQGKRPGPLMSLH